MSAASSGETPADSPATNPDPAAASADGQRGGRGKLPRSSQRRPVVRRATRTAKRATVFTHRWLSLSLGIVLLVITTTGAAVVYAPEWVKWSNASVFEVTQADHPVSVIDAIAIVEKAHPDFQADAVNVYDGLDEVLSANDDKYPGFYGVDPGTGRITGYANPNAGFMAVMLQVHECFFTCDDYPAYASWLDHPMPTLGMGWLKDVTIGGFILGVFGLMLLFLAVSGIWLWWPSLRRFSTGFRVRLHKGRYARDYDLHALVGIVAVPFLLVWGLTGASFEFHWVSTAFYAVTGGQQVDYPDLTSAKVAKGTRDITPAQALAAAQKIAGPRAVVANLFLPDADDQASAYSVYFSRGFDQYRYGSYPGQYEVQVDRHNAGRTLVDDLGAAPSVSNKLLDSWGGALFHYGQSFNGWWRLFWFIFGLTPLALAVTGVSTWLVKRTVRKRRRAAQASDPAGSDVATGTATRGRGPEAAAGTEDAATAGQPGTAESAAEPASPEGTV